MGEVGGSIVGGIIGKGIGEVVGGKLIYLILNELIIVSSNSYTRQGQAGERLRKKNWRNRRYSVWS